MRSLSLCSALISVAGFVLLCFATPALAVDGVLEINQTCAVQAGCFAGDTPGFPVTISASGSYQLTSGLQVPNADTTAVEIQTGDAALDLNGFRILGPSTVGTGVRIYAPLPAATKDGIVVKNGLVFGMGDGGILLPGQSAARVENMHVISNKGLGIRVGGSSVVSGSIVRNNTGVGIQFDTGSKVTDNVVVTNAGVGFRGAPDLSRAIVSRSTPE